MEIGALLGQTSQPVVDVREVLELVDGFYSDAIYLLIAAFGVVGVVVPALVQLVQWRSFVRTENRIKEELVKRVEKTEGELKEKVEQAMRAAREVEERAREELLREANKVGGEMMQWQGAALARQEQFGFAGMYFLHAAERFSRCGESMGREVLASLDHAIGLVSRVSRGESELEKNDMKSWVERGTTEEWAKELGRDAHERVQQLRAAAGL